MSALVLTSERLTLRRLAARDVEPFVAYRLSERTKYAGACKTRHEALESFAAMDGQWTIHGFGRLAITLDPTEPGIGHVGPIQFDEAHEPEMSWTLWDAAHEGKGYATEAVHRALGWVFGSVGWTSILALVHRENEASLRVAERLGARRDPDFKLPAWSQQSIALRFQPEAMA